MGKEQMLTLNNGNQMPVLAYGTWKIENGAATTEAVKKAIEAGYRHIDTAAAYGNDFAAGKAVKQCGIPREELFITNKLWNAYRGYEEAITACKRTLKMMKLEYLDAYLIHWPASPAEYEDWEERNLETWRAMEQLLKEGLVRNIGVSNFYPAHLQSILENAAVCPAMNQFEMHPGKKQEEVICFCLENGIQPMAWSPMGHGTLLQNETIQKIAQEAGKTPAQVCLKYVLEKGLALVSRSVNPERMKENRELFDFSLSPDQMAEIDRLEGIGDSGLHPDDSGLEEKLAQL